MGGKTERETERKSKRAANRQTDRQKTETDRQTTERQRHTESWAYLARITASGLMSSCAVSRPYVRLWCFFFFFSDRQPCRSHLQSDGCHKNQPSGRGLLPNPTAWSPGQHLATMLADISWYILGRTEGRGLGFGQLVRTHTGKCLKCQSSSDEHSDHNALCTGGR